jgi:hypothetical protein
VTSAETRRHKRAKNAETKNATPSTLYFGHRTKRQIIVVLAPVSNTASFFVRLVP